MYLLQRPACTLLLWRISCEILSSPTKRFISQKCPRIKHFTLTISNFFVIPSSRLCRLFYIHPVGWLSSIVVTINFASNKDDNLTNHMFWRPDQIVDVVMVVTDQNFIFDILECLSNIASSVTLVRSKTV